MAEDVTNYRSKYSATDAVSPVLSMIATRATTAGAAFQSFQAIIGMGMGAYARLQGYISTITQAGSAAESMRLNIAGTLRAYDLAGERMSDITRRTRGNAAEMSRAFQDAFGAARAVGDQTLRQLEQRAATLPGTAEDYLGVFETALGSASRTHFMQRGGGGLSAFTDFTANFAATAIANRIDAPQAGRDLMLMLQGMSGMDVRTWRLLQPLIHRTENDTRNVTAQEFNRWRSSQRSAAVERALRLYRPLLDQIGDTWEAQTGTFQSIKTTTIRETTQPIFQALSGALGMVNTELMAVQEEAIAIGRTAATFIADGFGHAVKRVSELYDWSKRTADVFLRSPAFQRLVGAGAGVAGLVQNAWNNERTGIGTVAAAGNMVSGGGGVALGAWLTLFSQYGHVVTEVLDDISTIGPYVVDFLARMQDYYARISNVMGTMLAAVLPGLGAAFTVLTKAALVVGQGIYTFLERFIGAAAPYLIEFAASLGAMLKSFGVVGEGALPRFSEIVLRAAGTLGSVLGTVSGVLVAIVSGLTHWGGAIITFMGGTIGALRTFVGLVETFVLPNLLMLAGPLAPFVAGVKAVTGALFLLAQYIRTLPGIGRWFSSATGGGGTGRPGQDDPDDAARRGREMIEGFNRRLYDMRKQLAGEKAGANSRTPPSDRPRGAYNDFRYSRFDINQRFAEGFDPDRIAAVFASDLEAMAEQKLSGGFVPVMSAAG